VIISFPRAKSQSEEAGHNVIDEVRLLLIHGILHLNGYDHQDPKQKAIMWHKQNILIKKLSLHLNKISGDDESYG
jgi:probable rRNA maturation factor